jgi:UDP:flavonoid glycosyltransferase YjiC (YdhE family)
LGHVVFSTFGSFGDLHPYIALAIEMRNRGHRSTVATSEVYRTKVESEGLHFAPVRPDVGELIGDSSFIQKLWDPKRGTEYLLREYVIPRIEQSYEDLLAACNDADLIVSHSITYAAPIVAEVLGLPWVSVALQPTVFLSSWDPPVLAPAPWFHHLRILGYGPYSRLFGLMKRRAGSWVEPIQELRLRTGLKRSVANPIFEGQFSPFATIAFFSPHFARPQPDWPSNVHCVGFPFYDLQEAGQRMEAALSEFLAAGPPPVVFTLGSSAVLQAGSFYQASLEAAKRLGIRAVLLTGFQAEGGPLPSVPDSIHVAAYAPYSELLPHAAATVHQGGIGTTAQALRAGRPMIVVPWAHDQPDNAERIRKLSVGRSLSRKDYTASRIETELRQLLNNSAYQAKSDELGKKIRAEDGVKVACDLLGTMLG